MRVVFMGTPDFAVPTLVRLAADGHDIAEVYTRAPARGGRGMTLRPSPVHMQADALGVPVLTPATLRTHEAADIFAGHEADVAVVVAYGMLLPQNILDLPRHGCLNLHGSILPRWRGAAPIQRAVMAGDAESGVGVMRMEAGLDTGPVALEARLPIVSGMTAGELHDALMPVGAELMSAALAGLERGDLPSHRSPRMASSTRTRSATPRPASTGRALPRRWPPTSTASRRFRGLFSRSISGRVSSG